MNTRIAAVLGVCAGMALFLPGCKNKKESVKQDLAESGYDLTPEAYFRAAESDDTTAMAKIIKGGVPIQTLNTAGDTALHAAAMANMMKSVKFLLDQRVPVDVPGENGRTPLMAAVVRGRPEMVRFLLKMGADPMRRDAESYRPLLMAVREGRVDMIAELAPFDREDLDNAMLAASLMGKPKEIDELANYGASVYARMEDGRTALMLAAENDHKDAAKMLLDIGANRFSMNEKGQIAADLAREAGHADLALWLASEPTKEEYGIEEPESAGVSMQHHLDSSVAAEKNGGSSFKETSQTSGRNQSDATSPVRRMAAVSLDGGKLGVTDPGTPPVSAAADEDRPGPKGAALPVPLVMRGYRQKELPLRVESVSGGTAYLRVAGARAVPFTEGASLPGSPLKVVRIQKKMHSSKENNGVPIDVSVVEVEDSATGRRRELLTGEAAGASDPVALVEDSVTGKRYVAKTGQKFQSADGTEYRVADVRPNQMVVEKPASGEVWTVPLRGPRG
ncbi:MAG: hypothetical protein JWO82_2703 [Akkermansiaceae bacterium]|nr:hypothetical protein [Akkermansiaceae bacterium]